MENNTKSNLGGDYETIIPKLNASERAILDSVLADVKQGKMKISVQTEYKIMYMFYLIKTHPSILEKLGYSRERDFGSFAHRFFGFEKSKASKYWRVGKLFIDYDNEHNEYFCKIAPVDMFGNRVELKPTFLLEMLFSSKYEKYLDITQFWYDCFTYGIFDKMVGGLCQANIRKINNYVRNHLETATTVQNFKILMLSNNSPFADKNNELGDCKMQSQDSKRK